MAVAIPFKEKLRADHALLIQDEGTRIGHALRLAVGGLVGTWKASIVLLPGSESSGKVIFMRSENFLRTFGSS